MDKAVRLLVYSSLLLIAFIFGGLVSAENVQTSPDLTVMSSPPNSQAAGSDQVLKVTADPLTIPDIVAKVAPSIVNINTTAPGVSNPLFDDPAFREFFGGIVPPGSSLQRGLGTGFIVSEDGLIITNEHVVNGAEKIEVSIIGQDKPLPARLIGSDHTLDLAVIKVDSSNKLPILPMGDSSLIRAGEWVVAIGNPYGLDHTVTVGVISALGRPVPVEDRIYRNLIQTDAAINPGNSGGPLINLEGKVIGINTAVNQQAQGIGFAIPINTAKEVLEQLITKGKVVRPWLGIYMQNITPEIASYFSLELERGVIISDVIAGSPADKAQFKPYDIILKIDRQPVLTTDEAVNAIRGHQVGDRINIELSRSGKIVEITVTLGEQP